MKSISDNLTIVAKVIKSYGTEGAVAIRFSDYEMRTIKGSVFIYFDGFPVPFFIESSVEKGSGSIIKFETVNDLSHAEELVGKEIFVEVPKAKNTTVDKRHNSNNDSEEGLYSLVGYTILNEMNERVGEVRAFLDYPGNPCLELSAKSVCIIPFHEELLIEVNAAGEILKMKIPVGLDKIN